MPFDLVRAPEELFVLVRVGVRGIGPLEAQSGPAWITLRTSAVRGCIPNSVSTQVAPA